MVPKKKKNSQLPYDKKHQLIYKENLEFVGELLRTPYSVSEWKRVGKERGYWEYFKKEAAEELKCEKEKEREKMASYVDLLSTMSQQRSVQSDKWYMVYGIFLTEKQMDFIINCGFKMDGKKKEDFRVAHETGKLYRGSHK